MEEHQRIITLFKDSNIKNNMNVSGIINRRRIIGKSLAFCRINDIPFQLVFKREYFNHSLSPNSFPINNSYLPLGSYISIIYKIQDDNNDHIVISYNIDTNNKNNNIINLINEDTSLILCKKWSLGKICSNECSFRHYFISKDEQDTSYHLKDLRNKFCKRDTLLNNEYHINDPHTIKYHKQKRAQIFVNWLCNIYTIDILKQGIGILDIAGGAGQISDECIKLGIQSTVIDPIKRRKQRYKEINKSLKYNQIQEYFTFNEYTTDNNKCKLIENCSILIGMHADEPTVDIVNVALKFNKPFAVIPCCVFTNLYPDRYINNIQVSTTEQLCQYIQNLHSSIKIDFLPFKGRNKVCYRIIE